MKYDSERLPFWELRRGNGPYTQLQKRRAALRTTKNNDASIRRQHPSVQGGNRWRWVNPPGEESR